MIDIYAGNVLIQTIKKVMTATLRETLEGEITLSFTVLAKSALALNTKQIAKINNQYFEVVQITKSIQGGLPICYVVCEHVSYALNDKIYNINSFDFTGDPVEGLNLLLAGTPFSAGVVEFEESFTIKINQEVTRRSALIQFIALLGGEMHCDGYSINIRTHRGSDEYKTLMDTKNVTNLSALYDVREKVSSYDISFFKLHEISLGDNVHIVFRPLGVDVKTRIIALEYNPFYRYHVRAEVGEYKPSISKTFYRMENTINTVDYAIKEGKLNSATLKGLQIVNENNQQISFEVTEDGLVKVPGDAIVGGTLDANKVNIVNFSADTGDVYYVAIDNAKIMRLTVDELMTMMVEQKEEEFHFIHIHDEIANWKSAYRKYYSNGAPYPDIHLTDKEGSLLYWTDDTHKSMTTNMIDGEGNFLEPVMVHQYDYVTKMEMKFDDIQMKNGQWTKAPIIWLGQGTGSGDNGKACIYKDLDGISYSYYSGINGDLRKIDINDRGIDFIVRNGQITGVSEEILSQKNEGAIAVDTSYAQVDGYLLDLDADSNLVLNVSCTGTAIEQDVIEVKVSLNASEVYTYYHHSVSGQNSFFFSIPLLKVASGEHSLIIEMRTSSSTFNISAGELISFIQGKYLKGGIAPLYPKADIVEHLPSQTVLEDSLVVLTDEGSKAEISDEIVLEHTLTDSVDISLE